MRFTRTRSWAHTVSRMVVAKHRDRAVVDLRRVVEGELGPGDSSCVGVEIVILDQLAACARERRPKASTLSLISSSPRASAETREHCGGMREGCGRRGVNGWNELLRFSRWSQALQCGAERLGPELREGPGDPAGLRRSLTEARLVAQAGYSASSRLEQPTRDLSIPAPLENLVAML